MNCNLSEVTGNKNLCVFFKRFIWLCGVFIVVCRLSLFVVSRAYSLVLRLLIAVTSLVVVHGL